MLQAFVSESIKPVVNHVVVWSATYFYVSQSDKGGLVFGGHLDRYNSYAQRGNLPNVAEGAALFSKDKEVIALARRLAPLGVAVAERASVILE